MTKTKVLGMAIITISVITRAAAPLITAGSDPSENRIRFVDTDVETADRIEAALPHASRMLERAMGILDQGWDEMSADDQASFTKFFDPGKTGEVDQAFIEEVRANFAKIHSDLHGEITIVYQADAGKCTGMRLFYTDFARIHVCPYIHEEKNMGRIARDLAHEMAHISLLVVDRAYFSETDSRYLSLTPHGHWTSDLPVIGKLAREIARADTLYHPDAYARYAAAVVSN
ncbi:MAG: hypothetical protein R3335_11995 [Anaerolineales bacterium]|nr:hypothetical protein [Anaerolineales bacterium]